jgi:hypothetical protein
MPLISISSLCSIIRIFTPYFVQLFCAAYLKSLAFGRESVTEERT